METEEMRRVGVSTDITHGRMTVEHFRAAFRLRSKLESQGTEADASSHARWAKRRNRGYPVQIDVPPPSWRPISTPAYGVIVFTVTGGELVDNAAAALYAEVLSDTDLASMSWRPASPDELVMTWPSKSAPNDAERARGWWQPTKSELVVARNTVRSRERRSQDAR